MYQDTSVAKCSVAQCKSLGAVEVEYMWILEKGQINLMMSCGV